MRKNGACLVNTSTPKPISIQNPSAGPGPHIYSELRRSGNTVRSPIDCCIAQLGLDHHLTLLHQDRDFEAIAQIRPLSQIRFDRLK
jgi:predicted nucleic acid-binding protein